MHQRYDHMASPFLLLLALMAAARAQGDLERRQSAEGGEVAAWFSMPGNNVTEAKLRRPKP